MEATVERTRQSVADPKPLSKREKELREKVDRIYRKYGTNLTAFYKDAHRDAQRDAEKRAR
jgi:hypothetical protein